MASKILIVEDDPRISELVEKNLGSAGYACASCRDGSRALAVFERYGPDLLVLDLMLPGADGIEITRLIRRRSKVPILMLTARAGEGDIVLGFEVGADDYLTKPFSIQELLARIRALLRRSSYERHEETLQRGELLIDLGKRELRRGDSGIELTSLEFDLLHTLALRPGRVFSRQALMDQVWGHDRVVDDRSIDSLVSRLRKKLEGGAGRPRYIQTVWGAGYRFVETES
jgi:two-component system response regulator MtrA